MALIFLGGKVKFNVVWSTRAPRVLPLSPLDLDMTLHT